MITALLSWCFCCRHTPAHAHSGAQRGRASSAALWLRLHSSTGLRPATTAQLRLWHVNNLNTPPHPPRLVPTPSFHLSFSLCSSPASYGLLLATGATSKQQPTLVLSTIFLLSCPVTREKRINASKGLLFLSFEKKLDHVCFFFTFHIYDYLFRFFYVNVMFFFYCFMVCAEVDLLQLSNEPLK